jgi:hypothetical protein
MLKLTIIQSRPRRFKKEERGEEKGILGKSRQEGGKLNKY